MEISPKEAFWVLMTFRSGLKVYFLKGIILVSPNNMKIGIKKIEFRNVPIHFHWSLLLAPLWLLVIATYQEMSFSQIAIYAYIISIMFLSVLIHELGHILFAQKYGLEVEFLSLSLLGGFIRLERNLKNPIQDFWVSFGGPLVNFIVVVIIGIGYVIFNPIGLEGLKFNPQYLFLKKPISVFLPILFYINLFFFIFNLLPVVPFDGGRIFRSLITIITNKSQAELLTLRFSVASSILISAFSIWYGSFTMALLGGLIGLAAYLELSPRLKEDSK